MLRRYVHVGTGNYNDSTAKLIYGYRIIHVPSDYRQRMLRLFLTR